MSAPDMPRDTADKLTQVLAHPESRCARCGGPNVSWAAPSPLWNAVMRQHDGVDLHDGMVCPTCFALLARDTGVARWFYLSAPEFVTEGTVNADGRVWSDAARLWVEPHACVCGRTRTEHAAGEHTIRVGRSEAMFLTDGTAAVIS